MLAVLSELDCLKVLNNFGVYPDEFYTDMEMFKNRSISFRDATLMVIFAGNFKFNKKLTIEMIKNFVKRASADTDVGIKKVYVLSDTSIPSLNKYYKYTGNINRVDIMRGWDIVRKDIDIWKFLKTSKCETKCFMSLYDLGNSNQAEDDYKKRRGSLTEDEYVKLIHIPDLKAMLSVS